MKCGKTRVTKSKFVLVLNLTEVFSGPITQRCKAKTKQSRVIFATQLKIALFTRNLLSWPPCFL